jgi:hypothetical protein
VTSALEGGGWSAPHPGRFTPGKDPVPIVQEAGMSLLVQCVHLLLVYCMLHYKPNLGIANFNECLSVVLSKANLRSI